MRKRRIEPAAIADELERCKVSIDVIRAWGVGGIKRQLGIIGDYKRSYEVARHSILDNHFALVVAVDLLRRHPWMQRKYERELHNLNKELMKFYSEREAMIDEMVSSSEKTGKIEIKAPELKLRK